MVSRKKALTTMPVSANYRHLSKRSVRASPRLRSAISQPPLLVAASLIFWAIVRLLQVYYAGWGSGFDVGIYRTYAQLWELEALLTWTFSRNIRRALYPCSCFPT